MFAKIDIKLINKLKLIITTILLFIFHGSFSQNNKINVSPFTLDIEGGINIPTGEFNDYATNGYQVGLMINKGVYKNLGLGVSANYNHFGLKDNFESPDNSWTNISFGIGPQYTLPINIFFIQLYGHIGMSLIKTPGITKDAENIPDYSEKYNDGFFNTFNLESKNITDFHTDIGIKLGAQLSSKVRLFIGSSYNTSLSNPVKYSSRDISKAFHPSGEIETDVIRSTPFEEKSLAFSSFNVNAGISFNLGKTSAVRPAQDYNSSRSNRPTPIRDLVTGNDTVAITAQDYNSSRSNKPRPMSEIINNNDSLPKPLYAQDYNSSRSNRPTPIRDLVTGNDTVAITAQDYNSSRSNKPRPMSEIINNNDSLPKPLYAQDYNSSRSNKPRPIAEIVSENDSVAKPAQDYNSSRSNRPTPIRDLVTGNDTVAITAQDYNSSRSNRPTPIRVIDDIDDINNREEEVVVIAELITIDIKSRSFALIDKNKQKIIGKFQPKVSNKEIKQLKRDFLNKKANIYLKINKSKLGTGKEIISYEL